jgi:hypothetical protein
MRLNGPVRLNGSAQIIRSSDSSYTLTYTPLGAGPGERPARRFEGARDLERFLAGPLRVARREILAALVARSQRQLPHRGDLALTRRAGAGGNAPLTGRLVPG